MPPTNIEGIGDKISTAKIFKMTHRGAGCTSKISQVRGRVLLCNEFTRYLKKLQIICLTGTSTRMLCWDIAKKKSRNEDGAYFQYMSSDTKKTGKYLAPRQACVCDHFVHRADEATPRAGPVRAQHSPPKHILKA
jgi:hypothetical protein